MHIEYVTDLSGNVGFDLGVVSTHNGRVEVSVVESRRQAQGRAIA